MMNMRERKAQRRHSAVAPIAVCPSPCSWRRSYRADQRVLAIEDSPS